MTEENYKKSAAECMTFHPRDWSVDRRDAWLYGIIIGWDEDALKEIMELHAWSEEDAERLKRLRCAFISA